MTLRELLSVFIIYSHNFKVLHWQACGDRFDRIHAVAEEYYTMTTSNMDKIAEMAARIGLPGVSYPEALGILRELDVEYMIVETDKLYDYDKFINCVDTLFNDILRSIENVHESEIMGDVKNIGIKSDLESIHNEYDLQARYLNLRRRSSPANPAV